MKEVSRRVVRAAKHLLRCHRLWPVRPEEWASTAEILSTEGLADGVSITCRLKGPLIEPLAPAGLYRNSRSSREVLSLHRVFRREGNTVAFETFGLAREAVPLTGQVFYYRAWWVPAAMEAALDRNTVWQHRKYPDDGNHDHCLFTWETIAAYAEAKHGYWCSEYGWITEQAYNDFIRDDIYRLRDG